MIRGCKAMALVATVLLGLGLFTSTAVAQPLADVALCLDVSGSMSEAELQLEVDGLKECLAQLPTNGNVAVSVTVYANGSAVAFPLTAVTPASLVDICDVLQGLVSPPGDPDRLVPTDRTDIAAGVNTAAGTLAGGTGVTQSIILVGDGGSNVDPGPAPDPAGTQAACDAAAAAGITICAIAVAADQAGQDELEACALATGGSFGTADDFEDFGDVCEDCFVFILIVECLDPVVPNDPGLCSAVVLCEEIAAAADLFGNPATVTCNPSGPYDVGETLVEVTATKAGSQTVVVICTVTVIDVDPPVIDCPNNTVVECDGAGNQSDLDDFLAAFGASDNCPGVVTVGPDLIDFVPGDCPGTGTETYRFTATDASGNSSECIRTFTVVDTTAPVISCNNPPTISPRDAPITFCATATDACGDVEVSITGFRCFAINGAGKLIDKSESCVVSVQDNCITITDSGGVGTFIEWNVTAIDECGNVSNETCIVEIVNPNK